MRNFLETLERFQPVPNWERDYVKLAESIANSGPFTLILFTEPLRAELWRSKKYAEIRRVPRLSERDEIVFRHFGSEINSQMRDFLKDNRDPEDLHLRRLMQRYYPKAKEMLKGRHPKIWRALLRAGAWAEPRIRIERHRRYDMPKPLAWSGTSLPQQFYFLGSPQTYARGCSTSSSSRETHSYFALAFLELSKRQRIPSYIFVYNNDNELRFVAHINQLLILPDSIGSNCDVDSKTVSREMDNAWKIRALRSSNFEQFKKLEVFH